jgi:hypothetical protein
MEMIMALIELVYTTDLWFFALGAAAFVVAMGLDAL